MKTSYRRKVCHLKGDLLHYSYNSIRISSKDVQLCKTFARQRMKNGEKVSTFKFGLDLFGVLELISSTRFLRWTPWFDYCV